MRLNITVLPYTLSLVTYLSRKFILSHSVAVLEEKKQHLFLAMTLGNKFFSPLLDPFMDTGGTFYVCVQLKVVWKKFNLCTTVFIQIKRMIQSSASNSILGIYG